MSNFHVTGNLTTNGGEGSDTKYPVIYVVESGENYVRYSDGLQICWGERTIQRQSTTSVRTYEDELPKPFKDASYAVAFGMKDNQSSGYHDGTVQHYARTASKISVLIDMDNSSRYTTGYTYIAIGRWK